MPVESPVNFISDLNSSYPEHTDGYAQTDSHLRLIKSAIQATFPNIKGAVSASQTDLANGYVMVGGIIIYNGAVSAIPTNWHLCDGTNGTPDLRDKFVIGAGNSYAVAATGGATSFSGNTNTDGSHTHQSTATSTSTSTSSAVSTATPSGTASASSSADTQGSHTHPGSTDNALALTVAQLPPHEHLFPIGNTTNGADPGIIWLQTLVPGGNYETSSGSGTGLLGNTHQHGLTMVADGSHSHNISTSVTLSLSTPVSTTVATTTSTTTAVSTPASTDSAHAHAFGVSNVLPPYYALAFIMRIS